MSDVVRAALSYDMFLELLMYTDMICGWTTAVCRNGARSAGAHGNSARERAPAVRPGSAAPAAGRADAGGQGGGAAPGDAHLEPVRVAVEEAEDGDLEGVADHLEEEAGGDVRLAFARDDDARVLVVEPVLREAHKRGVLLHH